MSIKKRKPYKYEKKKEVSLLHFLNPYYMCIKLEKQEKGKRKKKKRKKRFSSKIWIRKVSTKRLITKRPNFIKLELVFYHKRRKHFGNGAWSLSWMHNCRFWVSWIVRLIYVTYVCIDSFFCSPTTTSMNSHSARLCLFLFLQHFFFYYILLCPCISSSLYKNLLFF